MTAAATRAAPTARKYETLEDLIERIGAVPLDRIAAVPAPGTATEEDAIATLSNPEGRLFELVEGVLIQKAMGLYESVLAVMLGHLLLGFLDHHDLGFVAGEAAMLRLAPGMVRIPDICFVSWERLPAHEIPAEPVPDLVPDLAVEVISDSNTPKEMELKLRHYFSVGVRLVWYLYPRQRAVRVYTRPDAYTLIAEDGTLEGGDVLPGFTLPVADWLGRAQRAG